MEIYELSYIVAIQEVAVLAIVKLMYIVIAYLMNKMYLI